MNRTLTAFLAVACGVSGLYLVSNPKSGVLSLSKVGEKSLDKSKKLYSETIWENKEAEIIGDYLSHGVGGTTFRLPSGDVLKIVSLEKDGYDLEGQPNENKRNSLKICGSNSYRGNALSLRILLKSNITIEVMQV